MAFSDGNISISKADILDKVSELDIARYYFKTNIPALIKSPLREDSNPSFGIYSRDNVHVYYVDFATKDRGDLFQLLMKFWSVDFNTTLSRIWKDIDYIPTTINYNKTYRKNKSIHLSTSDLQCKVREWRDYDIEYWNSYGITLDWLKYAEVYPISHKIVIKNNTKYIFAADKYAYAYIERKEGKVTIKIYQPFNTYGYKWSNKHDGSVISLWTKIPEEGDKLCICSSVKDCLCLWSNLGIPSIAIQGEGYGISDTAIKELKRRFKKIYICLDNDIPGIKDAEKLALKTGFTNVVIPYFDGGKDISDAYKLLGKDRWVNLIAPLFKDTKEEYFDDLPFEVY